MNLLSTTPTVAIGMTLTAAAGFGMSLSRFGRRIDREVGDLWTRLPSRAMPEAQSLEKLPESVRRYLSKAIGHARNAVTTAHIVHGGTFRPKLDGGWLPVRGHQYFRADSPAFVWWGRVRMAPGLWIDARDRYEHGRGNMLVMLESVFTLANSSGPEIDQGSLLRMLAEMVWYPTAFLQPCIAWTDLGQRRVQARIRVDGHDVFGLFELGPDDLPTGFRALRFRDTGDGKAVLTEFYGSMSDYREVDGLLVPHVLVAHWSVNGELVPYARFEVERIEYDRFVP